MKDLSRCPHCNAAYTYDYANLYVCPKWEYEWFGEEVSGGDEMVVVCYANDNTLADGDTVSVIKDLKIKGSSSVLKVGTRVKHIRLVEGDHNIDCNIGGIGAMKLRSGFVRKVHV